MSVDQRGSGARRTIVLESSLESVDKGEEFVRAAARGMGFDEDSVHEISISVRECLVNAVAHGNRYNARKKVNLQVAAHPDRLEIEIQDDGPGFELDLVPDPRAEANLLRQSGRGLLMVKAFMDEFSVTRREPAGALVRMVKLRKESD
jgi:serine/threonine-protein kinase RsbW